MQKMGGLAQRERGRLKAVGLMAVAAQLILSLTAFDLQPVLADTLRASDHEQLEALKVLRLTLRQNAPPLSPAPIIALTEVKGRV